MIDLIIFALSIIIILIMGIVLYKLRPIIILERRMNGYYPMSIAAIGWIAAATVNLLAAPDYYIITYLTKLIFAIVVPFLTFWFILNFTESKYVYSKAVKICLISIPAVDIMVLLTTPLHRLFFLNLDQPVYPDSLPPFGILFWVHIAVISLSITFFFIVLYRYISINFRRYPLMIITGFGTLIPFLLNLMFVTGLFGIRHDFAPIGYFFTIILFAVYSYFPKVRDYNPGFVGDSMTTITKSPALYSGDFDDAAVMIAEEGCNALGVQCISVWKFTGDFNYLRKIITYDTVGGRRTSQDALNLTQRDFYKEIIMSDRLFTVNDINVPNALSGSIRDYNPTLCAYIDAPIRVGGDLYGIIRVEQHRNQTYPNKREWTSEDLNFTSSLANFMTVALQNVERQRLEAAVLEANQRMMLMLDTSPYCTQLWDKDLNITDCNEAAVRLYGFKSKQEYIDKFLEYCSPEYQPDGERSIDKAVKIMAHAFETGYAVFDWVHQIPNGDTPIPLPAEITLVKASYSGEDVIIGYKRDLREQIKMMETIQKRDRLLNAVNEAAALLLTIKDGDDVEHNLLSCMELVGRANKVDRVHIWKNEEIEGKIYHKCAYSWFSEAVRNSEDLFKDYSFAFNEGPKWSEQLLQGSNISAPVSKLSDDEQEFFKKFGMKTLAVIPLFLDDQFWGFFSFDDCFNERIFTEDEISVLRSFSLIMASSINRHELIAKRTREAEELTIKRYEYTGKLKDVLSEITKSSEILSGDLEGAARIITEKVCDIMNVSNVGFWLHKPSEEALINVVSYNSSAGLNFSHEYYDLKVRKKYAALLKAERIISMQSIDEIMEILPMLRGNNTTLCASLDAPVFLDGQLVAVIGIEQFKTNIYQNIREWMPEEQNFVSSIADLIALAISGHERRRARDEAELASQTKSIFLAKMSHEIRTPMNAIIGLAELALRESISDSVHDLISTIKQAGANLLSIINDILDFSKIESGTMQITPVEYSLSSLMNDVISIIRIKAFDSRIRFAVNIDSTVPNALIGDETRIRQVLINILGNAVKFTDIGFVAFSISGKRDDSDDDTIILTMAVKDSGRGIKEEDLERLFDDYFQPDSDSNKLDEGTGLGLAISRNIAKAMGGDITVESEYGTGSLFTVTLPQKIADNKKIASVDDPESKNVLLFERREIYADSISETLANLSVPYDSVSTEEEFFNDLGKNKYDFVLISYSLFNVLKGELLNFISSTKILLITEFGESIPAGNWNALFLPIHAISLASVLNRSGDNYSYTYRDEPTVRFTAPDANVLIVDDINTNLKVANGLLLPYEMNVDLCNSGYEALDAVQTKRYDIIFMDHRMPGIDGVETTERIRNLDTENSYYKDVPIIALTANAVSGMREMFMKSGFNEFMSKPIDTNKLNSVLERFILKDKKNNLENIYSEHDKQNRNREPIFDFDIEDVDVAQGIMLTGGKTEYYYETLATLYIDGKRKKDELLDCIASEDISRYITSVHALKSASANIGANKLSEKASALEIAAIKNDTDFIDENNDSFIASLDSLLLNIGKALASYNKKVKKAGSEIEATELMTLLAHLKTSLEDFEIDQINRTIDMLLQIAQGDDILPIIRNISKSILTVEYDEAIVTIDDLLSGKIDF